MESNRRFKDLQDLSFQEFVRSDISDEINNLQVKMIAGYKCREYRLVKALEHLREYFIHIFFLEFFDISLLLSKQKLGWKKLYHKK